MRSPAPTLLLLAALPALSGCAAVAVAGASDAIGYTFTNAAYRSFTASKTQVHSAANAALARMSIKKLEEKKNDDSIKIKAKTEHLNITIVMTPVTPKVTRVEVNARKVNLFFIKDRPVAVEVLTQMAQIMGTR